jgi:hypothetical protein
VRAKDSRTACLATDALVYGEGDVPCTRERRGCFSGVSFSWGAGVQSLGRRTQPFEHDLDGLRGFSWQLASLVAGRGKLAPIEKKLEVPLEAEEAMVEVAVVMVEVSSKIGY